MNTLTFESRINAPVTRVWETLWNDPTYRLWTAVFMLGSYAVSDWEEGSPIMFLSSGDCGMYSVIETKILNKQMSFRHLGEVINGEKIAKAWAKSPKIII